MGKKYTLKEKKLLKIQERASYNALKQFEKELMEAARRKEKETQLEISREKEKEEKRDRRFYLKYCLAFYLCPWLAYKYFNKNKQLYEDVIVAVITIFLEVIGSFGWLGAIVGIISRVIMCFRKHELKPLAPIGIFFIILLISVLLIIIGKRFSEERDSEKIYLFATTIMAILSFMVAAGSFFFSYMQGYNFG